MTQHLRQKQDKCDVVIEMQQGQTEVTGMHYFLESGWHAFHVLWFTVMGLLGKFKHDFGSTLIFVFHGVRYYCSRLYISCVFEYAQTKLIFIKRHYLDIFMLHKPASFRMTWFSFENLQVCVKERRHGPGNHVTHCATENIINIVPGFSRVLWF